MRFRSAIFFPLGVVLLAVGCYTSGPTYYLVCEFRVPKGESLPPRTRLGFAGDTGAGTTSLDFIRTEAEYEVYGGKTSFGTDRRRRAVIVDYDSAPDVVFMPPIPKRPKLSEWSDWLKPDYADPTSQAWWNTLYDVPNRKQTVTNHVELRFKVADWPYRNMTKGL